jgi:mannose-6-phosphate isomerase-like protein (cupin superfamily)
MPVFKSGKGLAPAWCELEYFDIVTLNPGQTHRFERMGPKEKLIVGAGKCRISSDGQTREIEKGANIDLQAPNGVFNVLEVMEPTTLIRMSGRWGEECGGSGLFPVWNSTDGSTDNWGGPVTYPKTTKFDNHYHDCDEYWIVYQGRGTAMSEGKSYKVGPGDCIVTGMGHHHDFPLVDEPVLAVFFETTMQGRKRGGHLWEHKNGPAEPIPERV